MTLLRTRREGVWELASNTLGTFLQPASDPLADTVITQEQLDGFELLDGHVPIPADLWQRWVQLCIEMTKRNSANLEVSCRILRKADDLSKYRIVVPEQKVTGVSVRVESFDKAVDIETGEVIEQWPPEGWLPCGSSHSHNSMEAFFSGTDDKYELGDPGIHIVVGTIDAVKNTYTLKASVTANRRRFDVDHDEVIDFTESTGFVTYHPNALKVVTLPSSTSLTSKSSTWFNSPALSSDYTYTADTSHHAVAEEMQEVMAAVAQLQVACKAKGIDQAAMLNLLAFDIEDMATNASVSALEDPFYWSTY